jgi:type IV pilus assembly protein PilQ
VKDDGELVQRNLYTYTPNATPPPATHKFTGEPISINLKDADLRDVLNTFAQLTGLDVAMTKDVEGRRVTIAVRDMPWDEALEQIARENGLKITVDGKVIRVHK